MKRTLENTREVLLQFEANNGALLFEDGEPAEMYHAQLLADGGYLTTPLNESTMATTELVIERMTAKGHSLLELLRDADRLRAVQGELTKRGLSGDDFDAALALLRRDVEQRLGT